MNLFWEWGGFQFFRRAIDDEFLFTWPASLVRLARFEAEESPSPLDCVLAQIRISSYAFRYSLVVGALPGDSRW